MIGGATIAFLFLILGIFIGGLIAAETDKKMVKEVFKEILAERLEKQDESEA